MERSRMLRLIDEATVEDAAPFADPLVVGLSDLPELPPAPAGANWDSWQVWLLRRRYEDAIVAGPEALDELAAELGRSRRAVMGKAALLGLANRSRPRHKTSIYSRWTPEEARTEFDAYQSACAEVRERNARRKRRASHEAELSIGRYCAQRGYNAIMWAAAIRRHVDQAVWQAAVERNWPSKTRYWIAVNRHEAPVAKLLRKLGYDAERTYRSRTPADVRAIPPRNRGDLQTLYIQCKDGGGLPPADWNAIYDHAQRYGGVPLLSSVADGTIRFWRLDARKERKRNYPQPMTPVEFAADGRMVAVRV